MDRILGVVFSLMVLACAMATYAAFSFSWSWVLLAVWTYCLGRWVYTGWTKKENKIPVGWRGQLLFLDGRQSLTFKEGRRFIPFPFGLKTADCRQTVVKLDPLNVITEDNIKLSIDGSIVRKIDSLDDYFNVEESGLKQGLDDIWDKTIRILVRGKTMKDVLGMREDMAKDAKAALDDANASHAWGIDILRVNIAEISPDEKVMEDLELKKREELQMDGQRVEMEHLGKLVKDLKDNHGLKDEQAYEAALIITGKADPKKIHGLSLDASATTAIAAFLGRK